VHHCRCFKINAKDIQVCRQKLLELGFEPQITEVNHGQVFGLRKKIFDLLQIHFKVMPNGIIESELEPPPEFPGAHLNDIHSYPPHEFLPGVLDHIGINYKIIPPVPNTCRLPKIIDPKKPLKWWEILIIGLAAVGIGYVVLQLLRK